MSAEAVLRTRIQACWAAATALEPVAGAVGHGQLDPIRSLVAAALAARFDGIDGLSGLDRMETETALATSVARAAVVAIAAGDDGTARAWLAEAGRLTGDHEQRAEIAAAAGSLERYRVLVHGRNRFARDDVAGAHARWQALLDDDGPDDAIRDAAERELHAPRALAGNQPELFSWNGIGVGFYGTRDRRSDGSHVTTHCVSVMFVPLIPLAAYRVHQRGDGYLVVAKEPLSRFARIARVAVATTAVLAIAAILLVSYLRDPDRLARQRFDAAIAAHGEPEAVLRRLDGELGGPDLARVDTDRAQRAGAAVVRLTAGFVPQPFARAHVDQVARVVARYHALPDRARGGVARDTLVHTLTGWADGLAAPADRDAQLTVLRQAHTVAGAAHPGLASRLTALRLEVAAAKAADWPLDALAVLLDEPRGPATVNQATLVIARLVDHPSLLEDAGPDLDAWLVATSAGDGVLRERVLAQRALAVAGRIEAEAEGVTPAQLAAMQAERPWDQVVAALLASEELHSGKPEAAEARLRRFGAPGRLTRNAQLALAQIAAARDQLDVADQLVTQLLSSRLPRFLAASTALEATGRTVQARLEQRLEHDVPEALRLAHEAATDDDARQKLVDAWFAAQLDADPELAVRRATHRAYADVVPVAITGGTIKLRRAQGLTGGERDAMLADAERTFLAIRTQAAGQPEFHLGLGEIYARLGKLAESDAELGALLTRNDAGLTLEVIHVYRNIGSVARATQIATDAYGTFPSPEREGFASLLGALTSSNDDESEGWYRKADQRSPYVQTSLLEIEASRLGRQGKYEDCARTYAAAAKAFLDQAGASDDSAFNNAAVAHQSGYHCSGDPAALAEAEKALEHAYRLAGEDPIVLGNLVDTLMQRGRVRVLARRVDVQGLRLSSAEADALLDRLLDGSERDALLVELTADPGLRRGRDLVRQHEVLAPNSIGPYRIQFEWARTVRDRAAAAAVLERMRQARALETSAMQAGTAYAASDDGGDEVLAHYATALARLEAVLARPRLDPRTRATALRLRGETLAQRGVLSGTVADQAEARESLLASDALWPAQAQPLAAVVTLIDELGLQHDAARWTSLRRSHDSIPLLAKLAVERDPLAEAIRSAPAWATVRELVGRDHTRPGIDTIWLARLVDDPAVTARARAALDDELVRLPFELRALTVPGDAHAAAALADLTAGR